MRRGFTLIELLVAIAIIGLLASVIIVSLNTTRTKGQYTRNLELDAGTHRQVGDSLVGAWLFDQCSGSTAQDSSGFNSHGSFVGSPTWSSVTPFGSGCSMQFNGTNQYINLGNPTTLNIAGPMTVSAWVQWSVSQTNRPIVARWGSDQSWLLSVFTTANVPCFSIRVSEANRNACATRTYNDGNWHLLVGIFDGANVKIVVDGGAEKITGPATSGPIDTPSQNVVIGAYNSSSQFFGGLIDNVRVYERALELSEIEKLYAREVSAHGIAIR